MQKYRIGWHSNTQCKLGNALAIKIPYHIAHSF